MALTKREFTPETGNVDHRRTGQHLFGGSNRVLPEWRTQIVCHAPPPGRKNNNELLQSLFVDGRRVVGPVPARYVRQSQICPQLDMSDKNDKKTHDISDKARCVRQKFNKIA